MSDLTKLYRALIADYLTRWAAWRHYNLTHHLDYKQVSALHAFSKYGVANTQSTAEREETVDPQSEKIHKLLLKYHKLEPVKGQLLIKHYTEHANSAEYKIKSRGLAKTTYYRYLNQGHDWLIKHFFADKLSFKHLLAQSKHHKPTA